MNKAIDDLNEQPKEPDWIDDIDDEMEFVPCEYCDGHPACEDFGCAFALGLGRMVKRNYDWG